MNNFTFENPTKLIFGKGTISQLATEIEQDKRILICFGGGSAKQNGVYNQVKEALKNHFTLEFWGIEPNPDYDTAMKAVELARKNQIDFLLAVGGGSVIDAVKFIAHAIPYDGEPWDLIKDNSLINRSTPLATVLTLPATGSEMNHRGVLSRRSTLEKVSFITPYSFPKFSILDPEVAYSLPKKQLANGVVDAFMHTMEQYMTYPDQNILMDHWAEGLLMSLIEVGPQIVAHPHNYDSMANFMLCAAMALNGFTGMGVPQDWATHRIGYELTILFGLDHAETLAVIYPALLRVLKEHKQKKLAQYATRVWNVTTGTTAEKAEIAIEKTESFFRQMGLRTRMSEYNIPAEAVETIYSRIKARGVSYGENLLVTPEIAKEIYQKAL